MGKKRWQQTKPIVELRADAIRRAVGAGGPANRIPLLVAAAANLYGSGRLDFRESEMIDEADRIASAIREHLGFTDEEAEAARAAWAAILARYPRVASYAAGGLDAVGLRGGTLWVRGRMAEWTIRTNLAGVLAVDAPELCIDRIRVVGTA